jgi:murein DD-endopeptidase MepM/ murein hydrolase activator NlpD
MIQRLQQLAQAAQREATHHRKTLVAAVVAALAGFGITAVAVAPLAADDTPPAVHLVSQVVRPAGLVEQLDALAAHEMKLARSDLTRSTDSAEGLLTRLGVTDADAAAFLRSDALARRLWTGRAGKMVQATADASGALIELVARFPADDATRAKSHFTRLSISRQQGRLVARVETPTLSAQPRMLAGTIRSTMFAATDEAGIPDSVAAQLVDIFSAEVDFHRALRRGDSFQVVYEALMADDQPAAWADAGRVLAAEFVNDGQAHHAIWFSAGAEGRGEYFGADGRSKTHAFLASPLEFSRVTSGFAMRLHPLQKNWRAHLGVDYAAPQGTTVRSVGQATVEYAGVRGGYGNVVELRHDKTQTTLYAHLSQVDVKQGQKVEQGQSIGAVGATGWATGPHLHFEFRVNGEHQDPLLLAKASRNAALDVAARRRFEERAEVLNGQLALAGSRSGPRRRSE